MANWLVSKNLKSIASRIGLESDAITKLMEDDEEEDDDEDEKKVRKMPRK